MEKKKVAVILPVYNVSKYLRQCVDSVLNQTLDNVEVVVINDASPDILDDMICREYTRINKHINYIVHDKNLGLGPARNTGIKAVTAKYLTFLDSDDWLEPNMLEELYQVAIDSEACIVQCDVREHDQELNAVSVKRVKKFRKQADVMNSIGVLSWGKLYKTSLFTTNDVYFPDKMVSEDVATMPRLLYFVNNVVTVRKALYNYRKNREGSISSNFDELFIDLPKVFEVIKTFLVSANKFESDKLYFEKRVLKSLVGNLNRMNLNQKLSRSEKENIVSQYIPESLKYLSLDEKDKIVDLNTAIKFLSRYYRKLKIRTALCLM